MDNGYLQAYLSKFEPIKQLPKGPTLTEDEAIRWLVDEAFRAGKMMIRTHHKEDIIRFIILAQVLDGHGYTMTWAKGRGVVGATRKIGVVTGSGPITTMTVSILGASKEVTHYADRGTNGRVNTFVS